MTTLQFADTHNLVMFLAKPTKSEGFEQVVDFLNASYINYTLTVNPTIYTSCIEQFWATVKVKTINGEQQLQALVDGKKIIIIKATVRRDLQLEDANGVDLQQLTLIGFVQVFLNNQPEGMATHNKIYIAPSHTKKLFANMRRQGKDFSVRVTPLFPIMVVQAQKEMGEGSAMPTDPHHTPIITQPQRKQKSRRPKEKDTEIPQSSIPSDPTNIEDEAITEEPRDYKFKEESQEEDASKQGRIDDIDADKDIYLVNVHRDEDIFIVNDLEGDEIVFESEIANKDVNLSVGEVTLAQALTALKSEKV
ncbi:hypothetical protein Tco_1169581 [Tanacetum coccineum]